MRTKRAVFQISDFKAVDNTRSFTCYGNVKNVVDHARDRVIDGAYRDSIAAHKNAGTMPKMFWMHNPWDLPIGTWTEMEEDSKGLLMTGIFADTTKGRDTYHLYKEKALDSFSLGYNVNDEKWNQTLGCNDLIKVDIVEVSAVTFACNEESQLVDIKTRLHDGEFLSKSDLRKLLESTPAGLSKRQIARITADYNPSGDIDLDGIKCLLEDSNLFK